MTDSCDHKYVRGSEYCTVCGRYRFADQVKEAVDRAPPLSPAQRDRIAALFNTVDIDMPRIARVGELAKVIERHPLLRYPQECACGEHLVVASVLIREGLVR